MALSVLLLPLYSDVMLLSLAVCVFNVSFIAYLSRVPSEHRLRLCGGV